MLDKVSVSKRKDDTIVARVSDGVKQYVHDAAKQLGVSVSAYMLQLIENDRNPDVVTVYMDLDVIDIVGQSNIENDDSTLSTTINRLIREGASDVK